MKTFNGKNITKKYIATVLRTLDPTQIYRLAHIVKGGKLTRAQVCDFIREFAPTNKVYDKAYDIAYNYKHQQLVHCPAYNRNCWKFKEDNAKHIVVAYLKEQVKDVNSNYAKRPMLGHTHLYFCSPVYGHRDYNKYQALPIKGNEKFCETVIAYADKFFAPVYDK